MDWSKLKSSPDGVFDCYPTTVTLLGLVPSVIELAVSRSNAVDSALEQLVTAIVGEVQSLELHEGEPLVHHRGGYHRLGPRNS